MNDTVSNDTVNDSIYTIDIFLFIDDQAKEIRRKIVEHNPYANAIARESVESARLLATTEHDSKDTKGLAKKNTTSGNVDMKSLEQKAIELGTVVEDGLAGGMREMEATVVAP